MNNTKPQPEISRVDPDIKLTPFGYVNYKKAEEILKETPEEIEYMRNYMASIYEQKNIENIEKEIKLKAANKPKKQSKNSLWKHG